MINPLFFKEIPKAELSLNFISSIPIKTILNIVENSSINLKTYNENELTQEIYSNAGLKQLHIILRDEKALERAFCDSLLEAIESGVRYIEISLCPYDFLKHGMRVQTILNLFRNWIEKTENEYKKTRIIASHLRINMVLMARDNLTNYKGAYFQFLQETLPNFSEREITCLILESLLRECGEFNEESRIIGFHVPFLDLQPDLSQKIWKLGYLKFFHGKIESLELLLENRVDRVKMQRIFFKKNVLYAIKKSRILIEAFLLSESGENYKDTIMALLQMLEFKIPFTISAKGSNKTLSSALEACFQELELDLISLKKIVLQGFEFAYYPIESMAKELMNIFKIYDSINEKFEINMDFNDFQIDKI